MYSFIWESVLGNMSPKIGECGGGCVDPNPLKNKKPLECPEKQTRAFQFELHL